MQWLLVEGMPVRKIYIKAEKNACDHIRIVSFCYDECSKLPLYMEDRCTDSKVKPGTKWQQILKNGDKLYSLFRSRTWNQMEEIQKIGDKLYSCNRENNGTIYAQGGKKG